MDETPQQGLESITGAYKTGSTQRAGGGGEIVALNLIPTLPESTQVVEARKRTKEFGESVEAGIFELDPKTIESLKSQGILPKDYKEGELRGALLLFSKGVTSEKLAEGVSRSPFLKEGEKRSFLNMAYLMELIQASGIKEIPAASDLSLAAGNPQVSIQYTLPPTKPQPNRIFFESEVNFFRPIVHEIKARAIVFAEEKIKNLAISAIKFGAKKLGKEAAKIAAKYGVKLAAKAGIKLGIQALGQAIGSIAPGVGNAIALVLGFILTDVLPWIAKKLSGLLGLITGERDFRKQLLWLAIGGGLIFLGIGAVPLALLSGLAALGLATSIFGGIAITGGFLAIPIAIFFGILSMVFALVIPFVIAIIATPIIIAFILFIINSGALIVPPHSGFIPGEVKSPYIEVTKTVSSTNMRCQSSSTNPSFLNCENEGLPIEVKYTVTVKAVKGSLTNITFQNTCSVAKEGSVPLCNHPTPPPPSIISATEPFSYSYTLNYANEFRDSLIIDTFTVTADVESEQVLDTTSAGSASVRIGNPPTDCPQQWPVLPQFGEQKLYVKQGPHTSGGTHDIIEAIDIFSQPSSNFVGHEITSAHTGTVRVGNYGNYGDFVDVTSMCTTPNGTLQVTSRYAHLNTIAVSTGQHVTFGQFLGTGGSSGTGTPHLHYEFRPPPGPIPMEPPYLPKVVPDGCYDYIGRPCNVEIP